MVEVRGEIYFPRSGFAELNERRAEAGEPAFANPRNAAAGTIRQLDPQHRRRPPALDVVLRDRHAASTSPPTADELDWMRERGFAVEDGIEVHETEDEVAARCHWWEERRESLDYEIDGVVVKVNERALWRDLGVVGREPRWAIAWKFPPITATTKLNDIVWNVGRTGAPVPVRVLEPVRVGGVTVSTATLHNEEDLARKDVRVGDEVVVTRAGDVIPQVISPLIQRRKGKRLRKPKPPKKCPRCDTPTVKPGDGVFTLCPNRRGCPGQVFQHVKHFVTAVRWTSRGSARSRPQRFLEEGLISRPGRHLRPHRRAPAGAGGLRRGLGAQPGRGDRAAPSSSPFGDRPVRARAPRRRLCHRARRSPSTSAPIDALLEAGSEEIEKVEGVGPIAGRAPRRGALGRRHP